MTLSAGEDVEKLDSSHNADVNRKQYSHSGKQSTSTLKNLNTVRSNSSIPLLGIY